MQETPKTETLKHTQACRAYHKGKQLSHPENAKDCLICAWFESRTDHPPIDLYRPNVAYVQDQQ